MTFPQPLDDPGHITYVTSKPKSCDLMKRILNLDPGNWIEVPSLLLLVWSWVKQSPHCSEPEPFKCGCTFTTCITLWCCLRNTEHHKSSPWGRLEKALNPEPEVSPPFSQLIKSCMALGNPLNLSEPQFLCL